MEIANSDKQTVIDRIKQVFQYLKALNEHRNPAIRRVQDQQWHLWLDDLPTHPAIKIRTELAECSSDENAADVDELPYLLRVSRPNLTTSPTPHESLREWLKPGWEEPEVEVGWIESRSRIGDDGEPGIAWFDDDLDRIEAKDRWLKLRDLWREAELPARQAMKVFDKLYALYGAMEREAERFELVVGDGILSWYQDEGNIFHPLLIQRVQLVFDAHVPEFKLIDADRASELYVGLFQSIGDVDPRVLKESQKEYDAGSYHPLDREVSGFLQGFCNKLTANGRYVDNRPTSGCNPLAIGRAPILFVRLRTKGFGYAIDQVLERLENRGEFCGALENIVGCDSARVSEGVDSVPSATYTNLSEHDILFGKHANAEQLRIARHLVQHEAVLVQGPPGTGKSHTIANLIGHLLSDGKSVLVTSHTTKALRVLRGHVVPPLQPLCVGVLESDTDSQRELSQSVQSISARLSNSDADSLTREAAIAESRRSELLAQLDDNKRNLLLATQNEYRPIVVAGKSYAPSEAAKLVAIGTKDHSWIPGPVAFGAPLPISPDETEELYATNASTTPDDIEQASVPLPDIQSLPTPEEFSMQCGDGVELAQRGRYEPAYWPRAQFKTNHISAISALATEFTKAAGEIRRFNEWQLSVVDSARTLQSDNPWDHLRGKIDETCSESLAGNLLLMRWKPEIDEKMPLEEQQCIATEISQHLSNGGSLAFTTLFMRPKWKSALVGWRVLGRRPKSLEEVQAIAKIIRIRVLRNELGLLWDGLMHANGGPACAELGESPEHSAAQYSAMIQLARNWWSASWESLVARLNALGFDWSRFLAEQPPSLTRFGAIQREVAAVERRLLSELEQTVYWLRSRLLGVKIQQVQERLATFERREVVALVKAVKDRNAAAYSNAYSQCQAAAQRQQLAIRRRHLLAKLARGSNGESIAAAWAKAINVRSGLHGRAVVPGDVAKAWEWRQLVDELDRRSQLDIEKLNRTTEQIQSEIKSTTNALIDSRAWARQLQRTTLRQRQSLMGWLGIIDRIGKGYGKRVAALRQEAQLKMEECRSAVPVWIMPLARLVENFDFSQPRFDVVIIDEASQCDAMGLLALTIGKSVVVVGDDQQVSPLAIGQDQNVVQNLIRLHLDGVPNAVLYDGKMSIYDLAKQAFGATIRLTEHFRCAPDIIQFSNYLSYDREIKPLREESAVSLTPHVVPYRVEGKCDEASNVNRVEADAVASLVVAITEHAAYVGKSIGVVTLLGDKQAYEIAKLLQQHLAPDEYERRRIICGNPAQFQGDERDVMFISMVYAPSDGPLRMLDQPQYRQRFNVAASRAKDQMWVVYSLDPQLDLKPLDLRRRLIEHALDPKAVTRELERAAKLTESDFERAVYARLIQRGYRVQPQWKVGHYRIDLVVVGDNARLAIECDGDRFHPMEKLAEDMERQAILERLGWTFMRIRGSSFYRDPDRCISTVIARLQEMDIQPRGPEVNTADNEQRQPIIEEIKQRAAELRAAWQPVIIEAPPNEESRLWTGLTESP